MTFTAGEDPTVWITGLITEKPEDEAVVGGVSEGLEGVGNRIPTTDPGLRNMTGCKLDWVLELRSCCKGRS